MAVAPLDNMAATVTDAEGHWLAGLVDGEGCFALDVGVRKDSDGRTRRRVKFVFSIELRADDKRMLDSVRTALGFGSCLPIAPRGGKPSYRFISQKKAELLRVVDLFRRYPLRSKKRRDFELWALALTIYLKRLEATERRVHTRRKFGAMKRFRSMPADLFGEMLCYSEAIKNGRRYHAASIL